MTALATVPQVTDPRELALLKAVGLDRVSPEQRELAINIAARYDLDLMLKHLVLVDGRPYITRDGLLHIAHRSGVFDGIEVTEPVVVDGFWRCTASVYRKDMGRPFTFPGRYPTQGGNQKFAPEMAIKVAESMALRRAFNIAAPTLDERWDVPEHVAPVPVAPKPTLAERVQQKAAEVTQDEPDDDVVEIATGVTFDGTSEDAAVTVTNPDGPEIDDPNDLSLDEFRSLMASSHITPQFVKSVVQSMFPGKRSESELLGDERGRLAAEILR